MILVINAVTQQLYKEDKVGSVDGCDCFVFLTLFNTIPVQATAYMAAPKEAVGFEKWHI